MYPLIFFPANYLVPKGIDVFTHVIDIHRDPEFWPEPDKFDPDRFLPERMKGRHPFCYLPFSAGPRSCIGNNLYSDNMLRVKICTNSLLNTDSITNFFRVKCILRIGTTLYLFNVPRKRIPRMYVEICNRSE